MKSFIEYTKEQINEVLVTFGGKAYPRSGQAVILAGGAGCYPGDTEFFTGNGWKLLSQYQEGDKVLQFDKDTGIASMVDPLEYINKPVDQFINISNRRCDFTTSLHHRHLTISDKTGKYEILETVDLLDKHESLIRGNKRSLVTAFHYDGPGIDIDDDMIRLKVAIFADGHFMPRVTINKCRVSLKKLRKIERFRTLLELNNIDFKEYDENEFTRFEFIFDSDEKEFESYWYNCNSNQLHTICDEVLNWDGSIINKPDRKDIRSFHTISIKSRDFIQFAFSACGFDTAIHKDIRENRNTCWGVYVNTGNKIGISKNPRVSNTTLIEKVDVGDTMYCFSVPSGFFVVRQKNKIYVSGNSGKGYVKNKLIGIEGKVFDVDALKTQLLQQQKLRVEFTADLQLMMKAGEIDSIPDLDSPTLLKDPKIVSALHNTVSRLGLAKKVQSNFFSASIGKAPEDLPNVIFDVTLASITKLHNLSETLIKYGYLRKNIHIVWIVNDIKVAIDQNKNRSRTVPEDILLDTHQGAARTMAEIITMSDALHQYMDGDIWIIPNKKDVNSKFVASKNNKKAGYFTFADTFQIKKVGHPVDTSVMTSRLTSRIESLLHNIKDYVPSGSFSI